MLYAFRGTELFRALHSPTSLASDAVTVRTELRGSSTYLGHGHGHRNQEHWHLHFQCKTPIWIQDLMQLEQIKSKHRQNQKKRENLTQTVYKMIKHIK